MLAYILALAVGLGSLALYIAAFFFPEIHRRSDFIWSGVGLFYALVLWVCAGRITGGLLLGQIAGVALLGWSVTQNLQLRQQTPQSQQTLPSTEEVKNTLQAKVSNLSLPERLSQLQQRVIGSISGGKNKTTQTKAKETVTTPSPVAGGTELTAPPPLTDVKPNPTDGDVVIIDNRTSAPETAQPPAIATPETASEPELIRPNPPAPELVEAARKSEIEGNVVTEDSLTPIEEIAPEVELAPPAEAPPEQMPPTNPAGEQVSR